MQENLASRPRHGKGWPWGFINKGLHHSGQLQHQAPGVNGVGLMSVHGVALVSEATALGVTHTSLERSRVDWGTLLQQVYKRYTYIAQLPM
jgi:hypothetical protein